LFDSEPAQNGSEESPILARANQCRQFTAMAPMDNHRDRETIVPEAEDYGPTILNICEARGVTPAAAKRCSHEPFEEEDGPRGESL
jgi:hypothetical protein